MIESPAESKSQESVIVLAAKALADPLRLRILIELGSGHVMSPAQFLREHGRDGDTLPKIARQFRQLERFGAVEQIEKKSGGRRRGAVEHFFRIVHRAVFDAGTWASLPEPVRHALTGVMFETYSVRVAEAMSAGTMDARDDRHFTWITAPLDEVAWENIVARTDSLFEFISEEVARAGDRLAMSGDDPIPVTTALAVFESPPKAIQQDPDE